MCFHIEEKSGNVRLLINGTLITECLFSVDVTQQLYFFFDLCGKINAIRLIPQCQVQTSSSLNNATATSNGNVCANKRNSALIDYFKSHLALDDQETIASSKNATKSDKQSSKETVSGGSRGGEGTGECCICWDGPIECVLYTCGHMCMCWNWYYTHLF